MVHDLATRFSLATKRNAWVRSTGLVLARPELLKARGNAKLGAFFSFENSVRMRAFADYAAKLGYASGKHLCATAAFQPYSKIDGFSMHRCLMTYIAGDGWDCVGETDNPRALLVVSMIPAGGDDSMPAEEVLDEALGVATRFGRVCHGVIDHDIYLANYHGSYYTESISPTTRGRAEGAEAWGTSGGTDRVRLCRDPREGLILSRPLADAIGIANPDGFDRWRSRHGLTDEMPTIEHHASGLFVLKCTKDPFNFKQSVRCCEQTKTVSRRVHGALCHDGFSLPGYAIHDEEPVRMYDSILDRYLHPVPD